MTEEHLAAIGEAITALAAIRAVRDQAENRLYIAHADYEHADRQVSQARTRLKRLIETAINHAGKTITASNVVTLDERRSHPAAPENLPHGA